MARDTNEQVPQPTDPPADEIVAGDMEASGEADAEGHSLVMLDLARIVTSERVREGEQRSRDAARVRESRPNREGRFFKRIGRR